MTEAKYQKALQTTIRLIDQSYTLEVRCEELEQENAKLLARIAELEPETDESTPITDPS